MPTVQSLTITYDALNEYDTFSEGDTLTGKVTLVLSKETTVESLFVKVKGDANVHWTTKSGDRTHTYTSHKRYFKVKQFLIKEDSKDTVVTQGTHVYKFSLNIPPGSMPSSFKGNHGRIVYSLEAKLSRSWRMDCTAEKRINFVSKSFPNLQSLMSQQAGSAKKDMGLFSKGTAHMDVIVDRRAYAPGETVAIVAKINNSSSKDMTPKFSLIKGVVYRANNSTKHESSVIQKVVDNCIRPETQKEVKCTIKIPRDQTQTIQNCDIISVEYHLKVYLDISFASDPEVTFPVVIIPPDLAPGLYPAGAIGGPSNSDFRPPAVSMGPYPAGAIGGPSNSDFPPPAVSMGPYPAGAIGGPSNSNFPPPAVSMGPYPAGAIGGPSNSNFPPPAVSMGPYPAGAIGGPSNSNFPPPAVSMGPYPASPHSGSYGYPGAQRYSDPPPVYPANPPVYSGPPAQPAHMSGGYNNPVPQLASPYGSPFSSSSSSSVLHPPPTAPTFQPPPCAPESHPSLSSSPFNTYPTAATYNLLPSAPMMNADFLSQSDEAPPEYTLLFPSSATETSDAKK